MKKQIHKLGQWLVYSADQRARIKQKYKYHQCNYCWCDTGSYWFTVCNMGKCHGNGEHPDYSCPNHLANLLDKSWTYKLGLTLLGI